MFASLKAILFETWSNRIFPSNAHTGILGSINLNVSLIQWAGIPLLGAKKESTNFKVFMLIYGSIVMSFTTIIYTGLEIYDMFINRRNLDAFTQNACLTLTHVAGAVKVANAFYRRKDIIRTIERFRTLAKNYVNSRKEKEAFYWGELENKVLLTVYIGIVSLTSIMCMAMVSKNPTGFAGKTFPFKVKMPSFFPHSIQIIYMALSIHFCAMQIVGIDFLNVLSINNVRYQMKILNIAFDRLSATDVVSSDRRNPNGAIKTLVQHHNMILEARKEIESIFCYPLLLQFLTSLLISALTGFQATVHSESSDRNILIYFYSGCIFFELLVYCWFGNEVSEQNKTLAFRGYNSCWYDFGVGYQRSLAIFLMNAQRPFQFTAGGFMEMSLVTFSNILSKSYTYIALLRQFYAEK